MILHNHHYLRQSILAACLATALVLLSACQPALSPPTPTPRPPVPLQPATLLARGCEQGRGLAVPAMLPGQTAIDFTLKDVRGQAYTLSRLLAD